MATNFDDAGDDVLETLAKFNRVLADCRKLKAWPSLRLGCENVLYALIVRSEASGCTRQEIASTLGVGVPELLKLLDEHRTPSRWTVDERGNATRIDDDQ